MNIYDFTVSDYQGNEVPIQLYKGKVLLIVNTATQCGLTPQYTGLQKLYERYQKRGVEILDFPCNQFLAQAPGTEAEINEFCTLTYHTTFPRFAKIDVNGDNTHPLFQWLKKQAPQEQGDAETALFEEKVQPFTTENQPGDIKWNFCKFLIGCNGEVKARYSPAYPPEKLEKDIEMLLAEGTNHRN